MTPLVTLQSPGLEVLVAPGLGGKTLSVRAREKSESSLTLETVPRDRSWYYAKTWNLVEDAIEVSVSVENLSSLPLPSFWTLHALIRLEDDMRLVFPSGDSRKTVSGNDFFPRSCPTSGIG